MTDTPSPTLLLRVTLTDQHRQGSERVKFLSAVAIIGLVALAVAHPSHAALPWSLAVLLLLALWDAAHAAQARRHAKLHNDLARKMTGNGGGKAQERDWLLLPEPEPFPEAAIRLLGALAAPSVLPFHAALLCIALPLSGVLDHQRTAPPLAKSGCGSGGCGTAGGCGTGGCGASSGGACSCSSGKAAKTAKSGSSTASKPVTVTLPARPVTVPLPGRTQNAQPLPLPLRPSPAAGGSLPASGDRSVRAPLPPVPTSPQPVVPPTAPAAK